jgi:hypothetical protein
MYRREHRHQLSFEDFFLPFGGKLSGENRWIKLAELIPWDELEDDYAAQFCKGFGAPAKPFRMALGALIIKARLGLTDEELVEQLKENPYLQFFIGLEGFQYSAPFDPSMMVYFRKRLPESVVNDCNERIVRHGLNVIRSAAASDHDDDDSSYGEGAAQDADEQNASEEERTNQGSLLIDATCVPADIRHPTDLSLLNVDAVFSEGVARELTETLIDAMHSQVRESFGHKPRTHRKQARQHFLAVALAVGFCEAVEEATQDQQDSQGDQATAWPSQAQSGQHRRPNCLWRKPSGGRAICLSEALGCQRAGPSAEYSLSIRLQKYS